MAGSSDHRARRTALYPCHLEAGARLVQFAGWEMPVQYTGIISEVEAVRETAGLFDVSHMGEILVAGEAAADVLQVLCTAEPGRVPPGKAFYTFLCNERGGIIDDVIIYRLAPDRFLVVANAANAARVLNRISEKAREDAGGRVSVEDRTEDTALLALQGPMANPSLSRLAQGPAQRTALAELRPFRFIREVRLGGTGCMVSRTGYTGEDGFEIFVASSDASGLWRQLLAASGADIVVPAGLGARDVLRMEAGYPLYGHELTEETTPLEVGMGRFVSFSGGAPFIGRPALERQAAEGPPRRLVYLVLQGRALPRQGYEVLYKERSVGRVTSGTFSPTLRVPIAMAMVEAGSDSGEGDGKDEAGWAVVIRGEPAAASRIREPFYRRRRR
ncbi:MAG: glycine cleavage system aminomethyltransferase GcvT [Firmicutes bacterium]|nr:glycine cleavage system aminomethyltransferase GcvT [Bacillota bacterium]